MFTAVQRFIKAHSGNPGFSIFSKGKPQRILGFHAARRYHRGMNHFLEFKGTDGANRY